MLKLGALVSACGLQLENGLLYADVTNRPSADGSTIPGISLSAARRKGGTASEEYQYTADRSQGSYRSPSKYLKYPQEVRLLIRHADTENDHCRGDSGDDPETLRACNRRYYLLLSLERKGWCWGGSHYGYLEHWLKCADDPDYRPGQYGSKPPFSDDDIREAARAQKQK